MRMAALFSLLVLSLSSWADSRADVLGTWTRDEFIGASTPDLTEMGIRFGVGTSPFLEPAAELFEGIVFTADDQGSTTVATAASDPDFAAMVELLTNGKDGFALLCDELPRGTNCTGTTESMAFGWDPDFQGATIDQINMTIDLLQFKSPGYKGATDIDLIVTFTVEGTSVTVPARSWSTLKTRY